CAGRHIACGRDGASRGIGVRRQRRSIRPARAWRRRNRRFAMLGPESLASRTIIGKLPPLLLQLGTGDSACCLLVLDVGGFCRRGSGIAIKMLLGLHRELSGALVDALVFAALITLFF